MMIESERAATRLLLSALGLVVAAWLSAGAGGELVNPQVPPPGGSDSFNDGYVDGCRTGFQDAGRDGFQQAGHRDDQRYATVADYKTGFDQAYKACFEEEKRNPKLLSGGGGKHR
jgi:hypothetical protein